jgi:hypothetical protein
MHFHHLLPENGGCVRIAATLDEHVRQLSERLQDPEAARAEIRHFISHFIRPHGIDRPATPVFADTIERFAATPRPAARPAPAWAAVLRPLLLAGALAEVTTVWAQRPHPVRWLVRKAQKRSWNATKKVGRTARMTVHRGVKQWRKIVLKPLRARR